MVERWTLRIKIKANNIIVTIQTNGGGGGRRNQTRLKTMPFRQKHIISFKLFSQLSIWSLYFLLFQFKSNSFLIMAFSLIWPLIEIKLGFAHYHHFLFSICTFNVISIKLTLKIISFNFTPNWTQISHSILTPFTLSSLALQFMQFQWNWV